MAALDAQRISDWLAYGLARFVQSHFAGGTQEFVHERLLQANAWETLSMLFPDNPVEIERPALNWPAGCKEGLDLVVRQTKAWAMIGEIKYFDSVSDVGEGRAAVARDIARLAQADISASTGIRLFICVFHSHGKRELWRDDPAARKGNNWLGVIARLLPSEVGTENSTTVQEVESEAADWQTKTPGTPLPATTTLRIKLLSAVEFVQRTQTGIVRVWQVTPS